MIDLTSHLTPAAQQARTWRWLRVAVVLTVLAVLAVAGRSNPRGMVFMLVFMIPAVCWYFWTYNRMILRLRIRDQEQAEFWPLVQHIALAMDKECFVGGTVQIQRLPQYNPHRHEYWVKAAEFFVDSRVDLRYEVFNGMSGEKIDTVWRVRHDICEEPAVKSTY